MNDIQTNLPAFGNPTIPKSQVPEPTCSVRLSERDEAAVVAAAESPPSPNEAALEAARRLLRPDR